MTDFDPAALWRELLRRLEALEPLVTGEGTPTSAAERAAGVRYLARFLAAGLRVCLECNDPDHPSFGRMIDNAMSWGLDCPDCNYSWAPVSGDAVYRISGERGTARQLELQVNTGHMGDGNAPGFGSGDDVWRTVSYLSGQNLVSDDDGRFEVVLSATEQPGNWLKLDADARHVLVRQYFDDWEHERPAVFSIERLDALYPRPALTPERIRDHFEMLFTWLDAGARCWDRVSRLMLSLAPNTVMMFPVSDDVDRPGLHGQTYGMGPFTCAPDEAVVLEFRVPPCRMWSVALTNFWWETMDFAGRQTSLNSHWAELDSDGVFRAVIAHDDPGVPNWLDTEGHQQGTLAVRFLRADDTPKPELRTVKRSALRDALPADTRSVSPEQRSQVLTRRLRAVQRRYGY